MKEKIRKFMDEPFTMRHYLKLTTTIYAAAFAACAVWYGVEKVKDARFEYNWNKKKRNDMSDIDVE